MKRTIILFVAIVLVACAFTIGIFASNNGGQKEVMFEEALDKVITEEVLLPNNKNDIPETEMPFIEPNIPNEAPDVEVIEKPDIITDLNIRLYNDHKEGFNLVDGKAYLIDIGTLLDKYAPDGMFLSAASAMAYTEGGAGKKGVYACTNNCFGIRAGSNWNGYVFSRSTGKVYKDYATSQKYGARDLFRAYDSMEDSVKDYVKLISGNYYKQALTKSTPKEYLSYILSKGYGEEHLLDMWLGVMKLYKLYDFDIVYQIAP